MLILCWIATSFKFADITSSNSFEFLGKVVTGAWSNSGKVGVSLDYANEKVTPLWLGLLLSSACLIPVFALVFSYDIFGIHGSIWTTDSKISPSQIFFNCLWVFILNLLIVALGWDDRLINNGTLVSANICDTLISCIISGLKFEQVYII